MMMTLRVLPEISGAISECLLSMGLLPEQILGARHSRGQTVSAQCGMDADASSVPPSHLHASTCSAAEASTGRAAADGARKPRAAGRPSSVAGTVTAPGASGPGQDGWAGTSSGV